MAEAFPTLFSSFKLGDKLLRNRIVMAPLTRQMAAEDGTPTDEMIGYYARRARGGVALIIAEGTFFSDALGCKAGLNQPGIVNEKHVAAWSSVTEAIHAHGASCLLQLMHGGRVSDPRTLSPGEQPVSASATQSPGWVLYTDNDAERSLRGMTGDWPIITFPPARALSIAEIEKIADDFAKGAARAIEAGFDGVEIHGANGYLISQFLRQDTNLREDEYGGSVENRLRFAKLIVERVRARIGSSKILTLRLSQDGVDDFQGAWPGGSADAEAIGLGLQGFAVDAIHWASFNYLDNKDHRSSVPFPTILRERSGLPCIVNGGIRDGATAEVALTAGAGDLVAIGRPLFAAPDWPYIVRSGYPYEWTEFDRKYVVRPPGDWRWNYPGEYVPPNWH